MTRLGLEEGKGMVGIIIKVIGQATHLMLETLQLYDHLALHSSHLPFFLFLREGGGMGGAEGEGLLNRLHAQCRVRRGA